MTERKGMLMLGRLAVSIFALAALLSGGIARADTLYVGGSYNSIPLNIGSYGGGSITVSALNGVDLPWVYCVDIYEDVNAGGTYNNTTVTSNGVVTENDSPHGISPTPTGVVNNAGEVAWLLDTYANGAIGNATAQIALQAAIWHVIYGNLSLDSSSSSYSTYLADLAALGSNTAPLNTVDWFSPAVAGSSTVYQALTGPGPVPEPSTSSIMFIGLAFLGLMSKRLVRGSHPETQTNC